MEIKGDQLKPTFLAVKSNGVCRVKAIVRTVGIGRKGEGIYDWWHEYCILSK